MSEWITDRLPPLNTRVLVSGKASVYIAEYREDGWYKINGASVGHQCRPLAWMPLPKKYHN